MFEARFSLFSALILLLLPACSSGPAPSSGAGEPTRAGASTPSGGGGVDMPAAKPTKSGALLYATDTPIAGLAYRSGNVTGTTDAHGAFFYEEGAPIQLSIGSDEIASCAGAAVLTPYQMAGAATCADTD